MNSQKEIVKEKVRVYLVKCGNNPDDAVRRIDKNFDFAYEHYNGSIKKIAECVISLH